MLMLEAFQEPASLWIDDFYLFWSLLGAMHSLFVYDKKIADRSI